ncbi:hypothetical protein BD779DRAFT_620275 [Infundibulicybe gibba]|nr:hypothetical protein BD779DRAFT_620275 [Infundibulicybe gibba]
MLFFKAQTSLRTVAACSLQKILIARGGGSPRRRCITVSVDAQTKPKRQHRIEKRIVSTLDPLHLQPSDFTDLSNIARPTLTLPGVERPGFKPKIILHYYGGIDIPFPNNTRGFFYYHRPQGLSFMASGLRFRVTPGTDASLANFDAGEDCLLPSGAPWQIPLLRIARFLTMKSLQHYLLQCGAITQSQLDACRQQFTGYRPASYYTLYTLDQPFPVSFSAHAIHLCLVTPDKIFRIKIARPFSDNRKHLDRSPYGGSALAQLQVSTRPEHTGRNVLVMKISKIIEPVTCTIPGYDGYVPQPEEGSLLSHRSAPGHRIRSQLWIHDLDKDLSSSAGLRALRGVSLLQTSGFQDI